MRRIKALPVILFAIGVTMLLLFIGLRGSFQSSLLTDVSYRAIENTESLPQQTGTGSLFQPFETFVEREQSLLTTLDQLKAEQDLGFYFPTIYRVSSDRTIEGGSIEVAFHTTQEIDIERGFRFTVEYPEDVMSYRGATTLSTGSGSYFIEANQRPGEIDVQYLPAEGSRQFFYQEVNPILTLPFEFTNIGRIDLTKPLLLGITNAELDHTNLTSSSLPYFERPMDVLYFEQRLETNDETGEVIRDVQTSEAVPTTEDRKTAEELRREAATLEAPVIQNSKPVVTDDQTRLSPVSVRAGSAETVFIYLSVRDADGKQDIQSVTADLTNFGYESDRALIEVQTGPLYTVYATSFVLSNSTVGSDLPLSVPYQVKDKGGHVVTGGLSLTVKPQVPVVTTPATPVVTTPVTSTPTTTITPQTTPTTSIPNSSESQTFVPNTTGTSVYVIQVDVNGDGTVDANDLSLFLEAYQQLISK